MGVALIIGCARAILVIASDGRVLDSMLYGLSGIITQVHPLVAAQLMFVTQCVINFFVHSGSGQAALTMPIMAPLADAVGITRQTAVLAFQFGEGWVNPVLPDLRGDHGGAGHGADLLGEVVPLDVAAADLLLLRSAAPALSRIFHQLPVAPEEKGRIRMGSPRSTSNHLTVQKAINTKILAVFQRLPANQKKVANYILQQPNELAFVTSDTLARRLKVSKPTIVRFARSLGYQGFTELQQECIGALHSDLSNMPEFMGELKKQTEDEALARVVEAELQNINETLTHFDRPVFNDIVRLLLHAGQVYTMGIGISSLLSQILAYELTQVAIHAHSIAAGPMRFVESLALVKRGDVVIAFSFPPYSRETIDAAVFAKTRGARVIAFTDTRTSPITFQAELVVVVRTKNMLYTNSISAVSIMMNAIVTELALKNKKVITPAHGICIARDA